MLGLAIQLEYMEGEEKEQGLLTPKKLPANNLLISQVVRETTAAPGYPC
jgi:hypothetical protein